MRLNQEIGRFLRLYCSNNQHSLVKYLFWAEYARTPWGIHLWKSPLFRDKCLSPRFFSGQLNPPTSLQSTTGSAGAVKYGSQFMCIFSGLSSIKTSCRQPSFKILQRINPVAYRPSYSFSTFRVSLLKPVSYSPMHPPRVIGQTAYFVWEFLDSGSTGWWKDAHPYMYFG